MISLNFTSRHWFSVLAVAFCLSNLAAHGQTAEEVAEWRKAAERGDAVAQYSLGFCYHKGEGMAKDDVEAVKWYRKAAEQGYAVAQYSLGCRYDKGDGVLQDYVEAVKWYRKAAEQGFASAQYNLATSYRTGQGVVKDDVEAYKWYNLAAASGHQSAANMREICVISMPPDQIAEAQRLSREWKPNK
jgi:TPR repeat protein